MFGLLGGVRIKKKTAGTKSHSGRERAPFYFLSKKHTEALHLSAWLALSRILLYVNLVYLSGLQGNAASASDSEMRHFSLLTKKGKSTDPAGRGIEALVAPKGFDGDAALAQPSGCVAGAA